FADRLRKIVGTEPDSRGASSTYGNRTPSRSLSFMGQKILKLEAVRRENSRRGTVGCGARAADWACPNIRDRGEPFNEAVAAIQSRSRGHIRSSCRKSKASYPANIGPWAIRAKLLRLTAQSAKRRMRWHSCRLLCFTRNN